jgi:hypothetical protein
MSTDESIEDDHLNEILGEIAYDSDFYEPSEEWRKEEVSYYGSERLELLVKQAIQKLNNVIEQTR